MSEVLRRLPPSDDAQSSLAPSPAAYLSLAEVQGGTGPTHRLEHAGADVTGSVCRRMTRRVALLSPPLAGFFGKRCQSRCGLDVLAHACVRDEALIEAARRVDLALAHLPHVAARLRRLGSTVQVIGERQNCSDLPQFAHLPAVEARALDERGRGYGGLSPSCAEENLLRLPSDRYVDHRDICMHELAHAILDWGLTPSASAAAKARLEALRLSSVALARWDGCYASTNADEFFAECSMWFQHSRGDYGRVQPPPKEGAEWLKEHDPEAWQLVCDIYSGAFPARRRCCCGLVVWLRAADMDVIRDLHPLPEGAGPRISTDDSAAYATPPRCTLLLLNESSQQVSLQWVDAQGEAHAYGSAPPGTSLGQSTFVGHLWRCVAPDGVVLATVAACEGLGRLRLPARRRSTLRNMLGR